MIRAKRLASSLHVKRRRRTANPLCLHPPSSTLTLISLFFYCSCLVQFIVKLPHDTILTTTTTSIFVVNCNLITLNHLYHVYSPVVFVTRKKLRSRPRTTYNLYCCVHAMQNANKQIRYNYLSS